jgi:hypothetical protein
MARFYRRLPSDLLDLPYDDFRLAYQCWRLYIEEEVRQQKQAEFEARARMELSGERS